MPSKKVQPERVVIGVDPHKSSWTAVVVGSGLAPLSTIRVPVTRDGYREVRRFATRWPAAVWTIEGAPGLGAPLARRLSKDGIAAIDVPAKLDTRARMLSTGHGRKNDEADAVSVGVAALTGTMDDACCTTAPGLGAIPRSRVVGPAARCPWSNPGVAVPRSGR